MTLLRYTVKPLLRWAAIYIECKILNVKLAPRRSPLHYGRGRGWVFYEKNYSISNSPDSCVRGQGGDVR